MKYRPYEELGTDLFDRYATKGSKAWQVISAASDFLLSICFICMGYGGQGQMVSYSYQCDALIKECL